MSHVIGIPLIKGNSNVVVGCGIQADVDNGLVKEGYAISFQGGEVEPQVADYAQGRFYGWAMDVNRCSNKLSVVRQAELVLVRSDGTAPPIGEPILLEATGLVSSTGTFLINGRIRSGLQVGIDGKTGLEIQGCVLIDFGLGNNVDPAPPLALAKTSAPKAPTKTA
jgi:hypothetical protein